MEIALIRHGKPDNWTGGGPADPALSALGISQAQSIAEHLAQPECPDLTAVYSSPMRRARETAEITAEHCSMPVNVVDDLAEYDRGLSVYVTNEDYQGDYQQYWDDITAGRYAGTQIDLAAFRARVARGLNKIFRSHPEDAFVAVFCHGGVISACLAEILGLDSTIAVSPAYTSITRVLQNKNGRRVLLSLNETPHLEYSDWGLPGRII